MLAWPAEVLVQVWDASTVDALAARVERCGRAISELGARGRTSAARARELGAALRAAGQALAFTEEEDVDAVFVVIERLDQLKRESDGLFALWHGGDAARDATAAVRWADEEPTRVMPRIVPPTRLRSRALEAG